LLWDLVAALLWTLAITLIVSIKIIVYIKYTVAETIFSYMPMIFKYSNYRVFFYSSDRKEPMLVHVERNNNVTKFWVNPVRVQDEDGFSRSELLIIEKVLQSNEEKIMEAWDEYFNR
jgi:hypothetical protein